MSKKSSRIFTSQVLFNLSNYLYIVVSQHIFVEKIQCPNFKLGCSIISILQIRKQGQREGNKCYQHFLVWALCWTFTQISPFSESSQQPVRCSLVPTSRGSSGRVEYLLEGDTAVGGRGRPGGLEFRSVVFFHSGHSLATEGSGSSGSSGEERWVVRDGLRVGPGLQLSCFCSVLSLRPFASLSRNTYTINSQPFLRWVRCSIHLVPTMILLLCQSLVPLMGYLWFYGDGIDAEM